MAIAVFNYAQWAARYPELAPYVDITLATVYFGEAGLYLDNTECSSVSDVNARLAMLNMIVAHIAKLNAPIGGVAPSGLVGPISSATEGSVSVTVKQPDARGLAWWFMQTTYGAAVWAALAPYRNAHYIASPQPQFGPFGWDPQSWGAQRFPWPG